MKKKLVMAVLCACMIVGGVACGNEKNMDSNTTEINELLDESADLSTVEDVLNEVAENIETDGEWDLDVDTEEAGTIVPAENLYDEEDEEYAVLKELQGEIKFLGRDLTTPVFFAENTLYQIGYGSVTPLFEVPEEPEMLKYFNNMEIGETVLSYANGKMTCYDEYGVHNESIDFNPETDCVLEIGLGESWYVFSKGENGYVTKLYGDNDGIETIPCQENVVTEICNRDGENIIDQVKDIIVLPSSREGYEIICLTNDNVLYEVTNVYKESLEVKLASDAITNVETVYAPASVGLNLTEAVYSKIGDATSVYSMAPGESLFETEDDYEIVFPMPDGHVASEIVDIFSCGYAMVFVFENGDVYVTPEIEEAGTDIYEMTKLEEISELNREGKILSMTGGTTLLDNYVYFIMDTNELYYYMIED